MSISRLMSLLTTKGQTMQASLYRVQYPEGSWFRTCTVTFPELCDLVGDTADALRLVVQGPGHFAYDLKLLAIDTYGDPAPLR